MLKISTESGTTYHVREEGDKRLIKRIPKAGGAKLQDDGLWCELKQPIFPVAGVPMRIMMCYNTVPRIVLRCTTLVTSIEVATDE